MDKTTTVADLKDKIRLFSEKRDWDQFHGAKDLAIAVITEASELLEHFRFRTDEEVEALFANTEKKEMIAEEIADVMIFLLRLAQRYNIDISNACTQKLNKNELRFPVKKVKRKKFLDYK